MRRPVGSGFLARRAVLAMGITLMAVVALATPAVAGPRPLADPKPLSPVPAPARTAHPVPAGFDSWKEVYVLQDRLNAAANKILAAGGAGNASIVASPLARELRVHWKGPVPASVTNAANGFSVAVRFLPAAYTLTELVTEAQFLTGDPRVVQVAPKADGSGLDVTVDSAVRRPDGNADLLSAARVAVTVKPGQRSQALFGRQDDVPFFWGGARYNSPLGGCSTGFSLRLPTAAPEFMLSAGHCGNNFQAVSIPLQPNPTGVIVAKNTCRDILLVDLPAGVGGAVYTGGPNSSAGAALVAPGAGADFVGNLITTSGATSGQHDNIPVQAVNVFAAVGGIPCATVGPLTMAGYATATCAVAPGDSGGPAVAFSGAGVVGRGTITAGNVGSAICPAPGGGTVVGANTVVYAPLLRPAGDPQIGSLQYYGVNVIFL